MIFCGKLLYLLCIWGAQHFGFGETNSVNDNVSDEIYSCDYTRFENKLERLKLQADINHQTQLKQQKELFGNMEKKFLELSSKIVSIEENLLEANKVNAEKLKDFIRDKIDTQAVPVAPVVDDKLLVLDDIKENLQQHEQILNKILSNQNDIQELIKEIDLENHTKSLKNTISDKLVSIQEMDEKLSNVLSNSIPKDDQLKFYHDVQQYLNASEIFDKKENCNLTSSNETYPTSCVGFHGTHCADNKSLIKNNLYGPDPFWVSCNDSVQGGGWTVIQRRINGSVDFYRDWAEYKAGFGNIDGEFFIGLDKLHALTSSLEPVELLIELQDFENVTEYAKYDDFQVGNETQNYELIKLGSYTGSIGDSFSYHVGMGFTTKDRDNDTYPTKNCAKLYTAAWWYGTCYLSNLNGKYYQHPTKFYIESLNNCGVNWNGFHSPEYSLKAVQMLIRPRKL